LLNAAYSRANETQADNLGLLIAARACYDTEKAHMFFTHLREHGIQTPTSYLDTHPADHERVVNLASAAVQLRPMVDHRLV
jgi:predicted Zn-dependent protease